MRRFFTIFCALLLAQLSFSATIHVPANQPTIQAGIDVAVDGDTVLVADGSYTENIIMSNNIVLKSENGFEYTVVEPAVTPQSILRIQQAFNAEVNGFTFQNGINDSGGAILIYFSEVTITNNLFQNNIGTFGGGGIFSCCSAPLISQNRFTGNSQPSKGAGGSAMKIVGNGCGAVVEGNLIYNELGMWAIASVNDASISSLEIYNNTIDNCSGGILAIIHDSAIIKNNIISNTQSGDIFYGDQSHRIVDYNDFWNNAIADDPGPNGISVDPQYANPASNDYRLDISSPCIDAGDPDPQYNDPDGSRNDIGAFPYNSLTPTILIVPDQYPTIQEAVYSSLAGDTVLIRDGLYSEHVVIHTKDIYIVSENGTDFCSIISDTSLCFEIQNSVIEITGLTLTGQNTVSNGGAISIDGGEVTILQCVIENSEVDRLQPKGGGICGIGTIVEIKGCRITDNIVRGSLHVWGGGVYCEGTLYIDSSIISNNYARGAGVEPGHWGDGGGVYGLGDNIQITNSFIQDNISGEGGGGGIYLEGNNFLIENCVVDGNYLNANHRYGYIGRGGGIAAMGDNGIIGNCRITNNSVYTGGDGGYYEVISMGGGVYAMGDIQVFENLIAFNSASSSNGVYNDPSSYSKGGGIYSDGIVTNNTIVANSVSSYADSFHGNRFSISSGGGAYILGSFENNIVAFNSSSAICEQLDTNFFCEAVIEGSGVYIDNAVNECNVFFANTGAAEWYGDYAASNMNVDPLFCDTSLQNYSLMDISPAVPENNNCGVLIGAFDVGCNWQPENYPSAFDLQYPPDTGWSQVTDFPTEFEWQASDDPDPMDSVFYRLLVALDEGFTFVATYDSIYQTTYSVSSLDYGTHYWWKVYAIDTKGNMTQSNGVADFLTWVLGDANQDGAPNVGDAVFLINYIFADGPGPIPLKVGDVNGDCIVNVGDAVNMISYIFRGGDPPQVGCAVYVSIPAGE